jgi:hypothetical protein
MGLKPSKYRVLATSMHASGTAYEWGYISHLIFHNAKVQHICTSVLHSGDEGASVAIPHLPMPQRRPRLDDFIACRHDGNKWFPEGDHASGSNAGENANLRRPNQSAFWQAELPLQRAGTCKESHRDLSDSEH